jgi:hypothetical protein
MMKSSILALSVLMLVVARTDAQTVDASVITSTLGTSNKHLAINASDDDAIDVTYEIPVCHISLIAARNAFKADLVKLLPALLAISPTLKNIKVSGGCPTTDAHGVIGYDDAFISAMFMRYDLDRVAWQTVQAEDLFYQISFGRIE